MNFSLAYLSLFSFNNSPYFTQVNKISFRNCQITKSFQHFSFNSVYLYARYCKFSHFLKSPIYFHSEPNITFQDNLFTSEHFHVRTNELYILNSFFLGCKSDMSKGGAIYSNGCTFVNLSQSHFIQCSSMIGSGAFYISSMDLHIEFCCIDSCHALFDHACYIQSDTTLEITNLGIIKCGLNKQYPGPCLELHSSGFADLYYMNVSHNHMKIVDDNTALIDSSSILDFSAYVCWYYSSIIFNSADVIMRIRDSFYYEIDYSNIMNNNISYSVFSLIDTSLNFYQCCIGNDTSSLGDSSTDHFPRQTPFPTETPFILPTPPPAPTAPPPPIPIPDEPIEGNSLRSSMKRKKYNYQKLFDNDDTINQNSERNVKRKIEELHLKRNYERILKSGSGIFEIDFARFYDTSEDTASYVFVDSSTIDYYNPDTDKIFEFDDCFNQELIPIIITEQDSCSNISSISSILTNMTSTLNDINASKSAFEFPINGPGIAIVVLLCIIIVVVICYVVIINTCPEKIYKEKQRYPYE